MNGSQENIGIYITYCMGHFSFIVSKDNHFFITYSCSRLLVRIAFDLKQYSSSVCYRLLSRIFFFLNNHLQISLNKKRPLFLNNNIIETFGLIRYTPACHTGMIINLINTFIASSKNHWIVIFCVCWLRRTNIIYYNARMLYIN